MEILESSLLCFIDEETKSQSSSETSLPKMHLSIHSFTHHLFINKDSWSTSHMISMLEFWKHTEQDKVPVLEELI